MNRLFVGKAFGVKEEKEKILPAALEKKSLVFDKERMNREKFASRKKKMNNFAGINMGSFNKKLANPKTLSNDMINSKFNKKGKFSMNKMGNFNSNKLKVASNLFLNGKFKVNKKQYKGVNEKLGFYIPKHTGNNMNRFIQKDKKSKNYGNNEASTLSLYGNSANFAVAPKPPTPVALRDEKIIDITPRTNLEPPKQIKDVQGIIIDNKEEYEPSIPVEDITSNYEEPTLEEEKVGKLKSMYLKTAFAKNRQRDKDLNKLRTEAETDLLESGEFKKTVKDIYKTKLYNKVLFEPKGGTANKALRGVERFATYGQAFSTAVGSALPQVSTEKFKRLAGFKVGRGFGFAAQSSLPRGNVDQKIQTYASTKFNKPSNFGPGQQSFQPGQSSQGVAPLRMPESELSGLEFKDIQKIYLKKLIDKRLESGRPIGERGEKILLKRADQLARMEMDSPRRSSSPRPIAQSRVEGKVLLDPQTQETMASELKYKVRNPHKDYGRKIMTSEGEKVYNPYGKLVSNLRGPYDKSVDTSEVEMQEVERLQ